MSGICTIAFLEGIYNALGTLSLFLGFGGFIFYVPIVVFLLIVSVILKIVMYRRGYRWNTVARLVQLFVAGIPLLALLYFTYTLFGSFLFISLFGWF
jgi:hypothetical protein